MALDTHNALGYIHNSIFCSVLLIDFKKICSFLFLFTSFFNVLNKSYVLFSK